MSQYDDVMNKKAVALRYDENKDVAPVIVASGLGYMAERIVEMANENGVPVYEDNSLATVLSQLDLGTAIPEELYQAIVDIYAYFLKYNPQKIKEAEEAKAAAEEAARRAAEEAEEAAQAESEAAEGAEDTKAAGKTAGTKAKARAAGAKTAPRASSKTAGAAGTKASSKAAGTAGTRASSKAAGAADARSAEKRRQK